MPTNSKMAWSLKTLVASLSLLVVLISPESCVNGSSTVGSHHHPRKRNPRPRFQPGPWKQAHATFYEGGSGTFGTLTQHKHFDTDVKKQRYAAFSELTLAFFNIIRGSLWIRGCCPTRLRIRDCCPKHNDVQQRSDLWRMLRDQVQRRSSLVQAWQPVPDRHSYKPLSAKLQPAK